jgi:2-polyprenyl-3-methyl-5-hydroxy-6-metoxy-1,4-benzoquinol methylase
MSEMMGHFIIQLGHAYIEQFTMMGNSLLNELKQSYKELDGKDFNRTHFRQNSQRYLRMTRHLLPVPVGAKILDIGCGFCYLTKFLRLQGFDVFAVDFFYGDLPRARCEMSGIPYFHLNIEVDDLPFEEKTFDAIVLGEVLEHFTYSPLEPLARIRKALKDRGILVLTTPNARRLVTILGLLAGSNIYPDLNTYYQDPIFYRRKAFFYRHNRLYTMKELRQLIARAGFTVLSSGFITEGTYIRDSPKKVLIRSLISPLLSAFPQLRDFLWVVAQRQ